MPDTNDPNSVKNTTKELQDLGDTANGIGNIFSRFFSDVIAGFEKAGIKIKDIGDEFKGLDSRIKTASDSLNVMGATADFSTLQNPLDKLISSMISLEQVVGQSKVFKQFSDASMPAINDITEHLGLLKTVMESLKFPGADKIDAGLQGLMQNATEAEKMETSFVALSAASGDLGKVFESQGGKLKDLGTLTAAYTTSVANSAEVTGLSVHQSMDFANAIKVIPGFLDEMIKSGTEGSVSTTALTESMKLMNGTGRSQADVIAALKTSYDDLSTSQGKINDGAQKGAEFLATISSVSTGLKLRFEDVRDVMQDVAQQFQFIGNETDAAARVLGRYTDALRETGLTSKASLDITKQMIDGISNLSTGTKAFMSLQAGGPGGLQGSFQIEQLLRQGKSDQVIQMAERNIKQQFGGRIYTQAEAVQSPEAAPQFMRQRQMLQSGVFGIGGGMKDDQATRLLEALGKGDTLAATKEIKTGQQALTAVAKQGTDIQTRNNNEFKIANRFLERNAIAVELIAGATVRSAYGTTGGGRNAESIKSGMNKAQVEGNELQTQRLQIEKGMPDLTTFTEQSMILGRKAVEDAIESSKGIISGSAVAIKKYGNDVVKSGVESIIQLHNEVQSQTSKTNAPRIGPATPDAERHKQVLDNALKGAGTQHPMLARNIATAATKSQDNTAKTSGHDTPKKVVIEILGPPGFHITQKSSDPSVVIQTINNHSTVVGK